MRKRKSESQKERETQSKKRKKARKEKKQKERERRERKRERENRKRERERTQRANRETGNEKGNGVMGDKASDKFKREKEKVAMNTGTAVQLQFLCRCIRDCNCFVYKQVPHSKLSLVGRLQLFLLREEAKPFWCANGIVVMIKMWSFCSVQFRNFFFLFSFAYVTVTSVIFLFFFFFGYFYQQTFFFFFNEHQLI